MSEMACLHCGATTHNGLVLCELCQDHTANVLISLPVHIRNLARWKPGRAGSRPVPGSRVLFDGEERSESPDRISRAIDEVGSEVTTWARALADDRGIEVPDGDTEVDAAVVACGWLSLNLTSIGTLDWAGAFVDSLTKAERRLSALTVSVVPGWYAGGCERKTRMATDEDDGICRAPTFVVPGLTWVTCGSCGATTYARDHLDTIITEAWEWVAPPKRLAEAVVALVDDEHSIPRIHNLIRQWEHRENKNGGTLAIREVDEDGRPKGLKRYRFGEMFVRLEDERATRQASPLEAVATQAV